MSFWKTHQFKKLHREWREKLEKKGFTDIETAEGEIHPQNSDSRVLLRRTNFRPEIYEEIRSYFYWAEDMANHGKFESTLDKKIWLYHSKGWTTHEIEGQVPLSYRQIARKIKVIRDYLRIQVRFQKKAA